MSMQQLIEIQARAVADVGVWIVISTELGRIAACYTSSALRRDSIALQDLRVRWRLNGKSITVPALVRKINVM